jgi:hypothetical protein
MTTKIQTLASKMIDRRTAKGWEVHGSFFDLYKIMTSSSSDDQKIRDLVYWDFATYKQAEDFLAESVNA